MYEALDDYTAQRNLEKLMKENELEQEDEVIGEHYKLQTFRDTFDVLDKDCSGLIDADELSYVMKLMGVRVSLEVAQEMIQEADVDNKGGLDFRAFVNVMTDGKGSEQSALNPSRRLSLDVQEEHARSMKLAGYIRRAWRGEIYKKFEIKPEDLFIRRWYFTCAIHADKICRSDMFNKFITVTILLAGVLVGIDTETEETPKHVINVLDYIVLAIFSLEIIVKVMAEGDEPLRFFNDRWNCFDVVIVGGCFLFMIPFLPKIGSMLAMLRLLRLLRVLKLVKALPRVRHTMIC